MHNIHIIYRYIYTIHIHFWQIRLLTCQHMDPLTWQTSIEYITHIQERDSLMLRALFKQEENRYLEYRNMTVEVQTFLTSALVALSWLERAGLNPLFIKFYAHIPNLKVYILFCLCIFLSLYCDRELDPIHSLINFSVPLSL